MALKFGTADIAKVYVGSTQVSAAYVGAVLASGAAVSALSAPVLTWTSPQTDNTPEFQIDLINPVAGDVVRIYRDSVLNGSHTLTQTEIDNLTWSMGLSAWANGTYSATATHVRGASESAASNAVTVTIAVVATTTFNPADKNAAITLSNGNLTADTTTGGYTCVRGTTSVTTGTHTYSITVNAFSTQFLIGVGNAAASLSNYVGVNPDGAAWWTSDGSFFPSGGGSGLSGAAVNDVFDVEWTHSTKLLRVRKNGGAWVSFTATNLTGAAFPMIALNGAGTTLTANFSGW